MPALSAPFDYPLSPLSFRVAGTDEAGRGPLMGDVVAACVVLDPSRPIEGLADSKRLTERRREALAPIIRERALAFGIGRCTPQEIDRLNILWASMLAMSRAYEAMSLECDLLLVDGNRVPPGLAVRCEAVVKGDARVAEIMAASILAKTERDAQCRALDLEYPGYGFARHKGYPTRDHLAALERLGILPCYRRSYGPVRALLERQGGPGQAPA
ncbi:MAG: ribonuclease HII [Succinivibrionaceae bacterium]|nr:ribonuclease HII [Succinivibrionaceae bacterium]